MNKPTGLCLSQDGKELYIANQGNHNILVLDTENGALRTYNDAQFVEPTGICISPSGELYIANQGKHNIVVLNSQNGARLRTYGSEGRGDGQFREPTGVCLSPDGELLFVADQGNDRVQVLHANGTHIQNIEVYMPFSVRVSHDRLYVSSGLNLINVYQIPNWEPIKTFRGNSNFDHRLHRNQRQRSSFLQPFGIFPSSDGLLYVADTNEHKIQILRESDGTHIQTIGGEGLTPDKLLYPHDICISPYYDELYVADTENNRINVFVPARNI